MAFSLKLKGFNYVSYYNGAYENADSLPALVDTNANAAALDLEYGIDVSNSTVYADANYTDSLTALGNTIKEAVGDGLSVMVRPLIDFLNPTEIGTYSVGDWRSYYNPTDAAAFFASYKTMIVNEATVAQANGATMLCIGTELDQLTGPAYLSEWTDIISAVRAVFSGKLTYSADWDDDTSPWQGQHGLAAGTGNLATQVSFWSQLDYVGIDCYAPLSDAANPTLAQLTAGWTQTPTDPTTESVTGNQSLISYFDSVATATGKPLLFTELGYESATDAASQPSGSSTNVYDPTLQANLYQAFFNAWSQSDDTSLAGVYFWNWDPNASEVGPGNGANFSPQGLPAQDVVATEFSLCFVAGTKIGTPSGEIPVQCLAVGDLVLTAGGSIRPIVWIGTGQVLATRGRRSAATPVIVRRGALADRVPTRDLHVTKGHSLLIDGVLIPVEFLVNHRTILWDDRAQQVTIYHIELATHEVLLANGAPAESYRDDGNRWLFRNANPGWADLGCGGAPQEPCAPVLTGGRVVDAIWRRLLDRAPPRPSVPLTDDPDLHVSADGQRIDGTLRPGGLHMFHLPNPPASLRIVSRAAVPQELGTARDPRSLGVAVLRIIVRQPGRLRVINADDPMLVEGFHAHEAACGHRWTDGNAELPATLWAGFTEPFELVLQVGCTARYAADHASRQAA
jgi:Hint domain/GTA TIM-barrel-like domain